MGFLGKLFGFGPKTDFQDLIHNRKAQIVDVRTPGEFKRGHVKKSVNIPLQNISSANKRLKKDRPVVMCCASGMRSGQATRVLKSQGYEAYNGGSWQKVNSYI